MPSANIFQHPAATQQSTDQSSLVSGDSSTQLSDLTTLPLALLNITSHLNPKDLSALALSCKPIRECLKQQVIRIQLTFINPFKPGKSKNQELAALTHAHKTQDTSKPSEKNKNPPTTQIKLQGFKVGTPIAQHLASWNTLQTIILERCYVASLPQLLQTLPHLNTLVTTNCTSTSALFGPIQTQNHPLQKLAIDIADGTTKNLLSLTALQHLQHLSLRSELIDVNTAVQLHSSLTALKSLKYDNCFFIKRVSDSTLSLSSLNQLTALTLQSITTSANINPATELHALSQLRYLNVSGNPNIYLSNTPQPLPTTLETVNLENTHVTFQTMEALQNLPALSTLRIGNTMKNTSNVMCLGQLSALTRLEHLSVQGCDFLKNRMLTNMLGGLTGLIMLNLKALPLITNNGLMHLTFLSNLQHLHIHSCRQISPWWTTYKNFSERHPNFLQVKMFYIKCQPMRLSDLMELQTQSPKIQIITGSKASTQEPNHRNQPTKKPTKSGIPYETTHIFGIM